MRFVKKIVLACIVLSALPTLSFAKGGNDAHDGYFYANPLGFLLGSFSVGAQFGVGESFSIGPVGDFLYASTSSSSITGFGAGLRASIYLGAPRISSAWYLAPAVKFSYAGTSGASASGLNASFVAGYQWVYDSGFSMNLGGGLQYSSLSASSLGVTAGSLSGIFPSLEFSLGYAW